jgi:KDO2-lipid IV(A) lauroyltransferase
LAIKAINLFDVEYPCTISRIMRRAIVKSLLLSSSWLPLAVTHVLGTLIGWGLMLFPNRAARDTKINIELCFPELARARQRRLVRKSLAETGKTILETGALWMRPGTKALQLIRYVDGLDVAMRAREAGNGLILATPHLGAWEAAGLYCSATFGMTCLFRPLRMIELEELVYDARSRLGATYVPATARGIRTIFTTAGKGGTVAMLPDQEPQSGSGRFAPFFGIPAYTMTLLVRLSGSTGAPVVFTYCERLPRGRGYHLHFREAPQGIYSKDTNTAVLAMNKAIEELIRECPTQYQWSYRRFGKRPAEEPSIYN